MKVSLNGLLITAVGLSLCACTKKQAPTTQQSIVAENAATTAIHPLRDTAISTSCYYDDLSNQHNYILEFSKSSGSHATKDFWTVIIVNKKTNRKVDSLYQPMISYGADFQDFKSIRSLITGKNSKEQVVDNNYGDMIVADFNFDTMEDIALVNDLGGNGGRFYSYYIQQKDHKFSLDTFLTNSMTYFPSELVASRKQLITYVHAGVCGLGEHIYTYSPKSSTWEETRHRIINICKE